MYRKALISFIDILGFKDLIENADYDTVSKKLAAVKRFSTTGGGGSGADGEHWEPRVIQFSDSIIRLRPLGSQEDSELPLGVLFEELFDLVLNQRLLPQALLCCGFVAARGCA